MTVNDMQSGELRSEGRAALALMEDALSLLDGCGSGLEVGAQLDLAICRLRTLLGLGEREVPDIAGFEPRPWSDPIENLAAKFG